MNVIKFGGSSLASAESFKRAADIVRREEKAVVVLSAIGKCSSSDEKITDILIDYCLAVKSGDFCGALKKAKIVYEKFISIADDLNATCDFYRKFFLFYDKLITFSRADFEYIVSRGEYYTCLLFCDYSKIDFVDPMNLIYFDKNGKADIPLISDKVKKIPADIFVTCGFYGTDKNGEIKLFPRGGGDSTAAVLAAAAGAEIFYDYTDVEGVYTASPEIFKAKETIGTMSYSQLYKMATHGANVFFYEAIPYVAGKNIKLVILDSFNANGEKTVVTDSGKNERIKAFLIDKDLFKIEIAISHYREKIRIIYYILKYFMLDKIVIYDYYAERKKIVLIVKSYASRVYETLEKVGVGCTVSRTNALTVMRSRKFSHFRKERKYYSSSLDEIKKKAERFSPRK